MLRFLVFVGALAIIGFWGLSHAVPSHFGQCHDVALQFGSTSSVRTCDPYPAVDYGVPFVLLFALLLVGSKEGEWELTIPGGWGVKRKAQQAANVLKDEATTLDDRTGQFLDVLATLPTEEDNGDSATKEED
jgi:hypothetical protein